ncbi:MAG: DUF6359 domain-containing protein [Cytophagaceae bacterium]|nr:DUF6359 domain-containing protein [Cytophagaceae bacterium]
MKTFNNRFRLYGIIFLAGSLMANCIDREFDSPPIERPVYTGDSTISIKNFKAKYNSDLVEITDNDVIMGVVTANDISGNLYKQMFIDDGEAGLMVAIDQNNIYNDFRIGQKVFIETRGLYMGKYGGLAQLGYRYSRNNDGVYTVGQAPWELFKEKIFKDDFPDASKVAPMVIGLDALTEDNFGRLVTFQSVMFDDAGQPFSTPNGSQVQTLNRIIRSSENAGSTITARMSSAANFAGTTIPDGIGNVTGILTRYNSTNQILVRDSSDINFTPNPDGWGTRTSPWTTDYALKHQDEDKAGWIKGIIVGSLMPSVNETNPVDNNDDINFGTEHILTNYIVIAPTADVRDWTKCIVVNLPEGSAIRTALNLVANPDNIGKEVSVTGKLQKILKAAGITVATGAASEFLFGESGSDNTPKGTGTKDDPYNYAAALKNQGQTGVWVKAIIVGSVDDRSIQTDSRFEPPFVNQANILIAAAAGETNYMNCLPAQLPAGNVRTTLNLVSNPSNLGKEVMVYGNLRTYFGVAGIGDVTDFVFEGGTPPSGGVEGTGTKDDPYNLAGVIAKQGAGIAWAQGYIIGAVDDGTGQGMDITQDSRFAAPFTVTTNILIAESVTETNYINCIPVQLPAGTVRTALNLVDNPTNLGKKVSLYGDFTTYFGVAGIKSVTEFVLDGGGNPPPTDYIFMETFGNGSYTTVRPKISAFTDFDNTDVTFTDPTGNADIRTTSTIDPHVWFPAKKESQLIIEGVNVAGYASVQLSFDLRTNDESEEITADYLLIVKINDVEQSVPATQVGKNNYINIPLNAINNTGSTMKIEFKATATSNTGGFRIDNIALSEVK